MPPIKKDKQVTQSDITYGDWSPEELRRVQDEREKLLGTLLTVLRFHFLWPRREDELDFSGSPYRIPIIYYSFLFSTTIVVVNHAYHSLVVMKNIMRFIGDVTMSGTSMCLLGAVYAYVFKIKEFVILSLNSFEYTLEFETPQAAYDYSKRFNKIFIVIYILVTTIICILVPAILFFEYDCDKDDEYELCGVLNIRTPFPVDFTPVKEIAVLLLLCAVLSTINPIIALTSMLSLVMRLLIFRMDHLQTEILGDHSGLSDDQLRKKLRCHCQYYNALIVIKDGINSAFYNISVILFLISSIIVALLEFQTIMSKSAVSGIYFVGWIISLATLHLTGQTLIDKNDEICRSVYSMHWYEFPAKMRIYVLLLLTRTQKPFEITNGPLSNLSAFAFLTVLKASYSYMTYLVNFLE